MTFILASPPPVLRERWPHFLPFWWWRLVLLCFSAHIHRYVSEIPCDLLPPARGACWLRNHGIPSRTNVQPFLPLKARTTGSLVSPLTGLEAPSCWTVVLELGGPGARRNIYSTSLSPSPTCHCHHNQHPCFRVQIHSPCVYLPRHFPAHLPCSHQPSGHLHYNGSSMVRIFPSHLFPLHFPSHVVPSLLQPVGPRRKYVSFTVTGKDDILLILSLGPQGWMKWA